MPSADTPASSPERLDPVLLAELPGLLEAATQGDWLWHNGDLVGREAEFPHWHNLIVCGEAASSANARLLALAPTLARAVLAAEARLARAERVVEAAQECADAEDGFVETAERDGTYGAAAERIKAAEAALRAALAAYREAGEGR